MVAAGLILARHATVQLPAVEKEKAPETGAFSEGYCVTCDAAK